MALSCWNNESSTRTPPDGTPRAFTVVSVANNEGAKQTYHCLGANVWSWWRDFINDCWNTSNELGIYIIDIWVLNQKYWEKPPNHPFLIGFGTIINHPFWGPTPIFGNTHMNISRSSTLSKCWDMSFFTCKHMQTIYDNCVYKKGKCFNSGLHRSALLIIRVGWVVATRIGHTWQQKSNYPPVN